MKVYGDLGKMTTKRRIFHWVFIVVGVTLAMVSTGFSVYDIFKPNKHDEN